MCGIVGLIGKGKASDHKDLITRMAAPLLHRGPDEWGRYATNQVGLGHTRLSIIDLASGQQPMCDSQAVISFNGEIYNYLELREELLALGHQFHTHSDTEVALKALQSWGIDAFARFNGQFAILFWDKRKQELLVGRDHYGVRPLFWTRAGGLWLFASELKCFDQSGLVERCWEPENLLMHGLLWNTLGDATVFKDIHSLRPGSWARFDPAKGLVAQGNYYRLGEHAPAVPASYPEAQEAFLAHLDRSVKLRLRSDVPVGCYLSGGIDSSVTSHLARQIKGDRFKTFSVAFSDAGYDESAFQKLMVEALGSEHHTEYISHDTIDETMLEAARHFERPVFRTAPVPMFKLSDRVRRENIKVVLTGEGADEILCGYDIFKEVKLLEAWEAGASEEQVNQVLAQLYPHLDHYAETGNTGLMRMYYEGFVGKMKGPWAGMAVRMHNNRILEKYLNPDWGVQLDDAAVAGRLEAELPPYLASWPAIKRTQYLEMRTLLEGYLLSSQGDRMSMAHGVEGRYPFLDRELVEWAFALPMDWKLKGFQQKHLLTDTFRPLLPEAITNRPKRPYMAPELSAFIRDGLPTARAREFLDSGRIKEYGIFDPRMVERLLFKYQRRGLEGIGYRDNMLVSFILSAQMVEYWIRHPQTGALDPRLCRVDIEE